MYPFTEAPSSTFELPGKHPSSEFQGPKVSDFRGTKPQPPSSPKTETQPVPHLNPPHPRVPMPQRLLVQAIVLEESFQTALGLLELALLNDSAGERPQGPLIQGLGASLPSCLISACGRS